MTTTDTTTANRSTEQFETYLDQLARSHGISGYTMTPEGTLVYAAYDGGEYDLQTPDGSLTNADGDITNPTWLRECGTLLAYRDQSGTEQYDPLEDWPEDDRTLRANVPRTLKPSGECYRAVEGAKGELGIHIWADGTETPARFKIRGPSFSNLSALSAMATGEYVADLVATLGASIPSWEKSIDDDLNLATHSGGSLGHPMSTGEASSIARLRRRYRQM